MERRSAEVSVNKRMELSDVLPYSRAVAREILNYTLPEISRSQVFLTGVGSGAGRGTEK